MPRYGVTAFCPTTTACTPAALRHDARAGARGRGRRRRRTRRGCFRLTSRAIFSIPSTAARSPRHASVRRALRSPASTRPPRTRRSSADFDAGDLLREIERCAPDVGIVTLAPELDGGIDLIRWLTARGHRVSLGHSAATYDEAVAAIAAGASQATHLFNRMPPLDHRAPGLAGAVLEADEIAAELICDGFHVHPAMVRAAVAAKRPHRIMAITDGTAAAGLADRRAARGSANSV